MSSPGRSWIRYIGWSGVRKEVSLRERCFGGPVRKSPLESPAGSLARARRVVFLIHGFNVNSCNAGKSFETFTSELPLRWRGRSIWIYWPGDATLSSDGSDRPGGKLDLAASVFSYPLQAPRAVQSAYTLVKFIKDQTSGRRTPLHVTIVAHSLGCLMAMEMVEKLSLMSGVKLELVILMAAAVPQYACKQGERYDLTKFDDTKFLIYHSKHDEVLQGAFRPGQFAVATGLISRFVARSAIGRNGLATPAANAEQKIKRHRHSGYWPDREIAVDLASRLEARARPIAKRFLAVRAVGDARDLQTRSLDGRSVGQPGGVRHTCTCP